MAGDLVPTRASVNTCKSDGSHVRRISLPLFQSDSGKDVPNYLRASTKSCHDNCKYGKKEPVEVKPRRPWTKQKAAAAVNSWNVVQSEGVSLGKKVKKAIPKASLIRKSTVPEYPEAVKQEVLPESKVAETFLEQGVPSGMKDLFARKSTAASSFLQKTGTSSEKYKDARSSKKVNEDAKRPLATEMAKPAFLSSPTKPSRTAKLQSFPIHLRRFKTMKAPSSFSPMKPGTKVTQLSSNLKPKSPMASFSIPSKQKTATAKMPPSQSVIHKKTFNFGVAKEEAFAMRPKKTLQSSSVPPKPSRNKVASDLRKKAIQLPELLSDKNVEAKLCNTENVEAKKPYQEHAENVNNLSQAGIGRASESVEVDVPEKTLYVIKMEILNHMQPASWAENEGPHMQPLVSLTPPLSPRSLFSATASIIKIMTTEHEENPDESTKTDKTPSHTEGETPSLLPSSSPQLSPKSPSSNIASKVFFHEMSQDSFAYTESNDGYSSFEDDDLVEEEDTSEVADNTKPEKTAKYPTQDNGTDPVKLKFRRGRVVDVEQEKSGPRKLKFRKPKVLVENDVKDLSHRGRFKLTEASEDATANANNNPETVILRHQDVQDKKDGQDLLLNNVIEETASKLVETRKSKVKALVGAFETVISLQDGKPTAA